MGNYHQDTTIDSNQTKIFQNLSSVWWDNKGTDSLKKINANVVKFICEQVNGNGVSHSTTLKPLSGLKVLEVGCGGGILSEDLARLGCHLTGIDPNVALLQVAIEHAAADSKLPEITYVAKTVEELCKTHSGKYDVVISNFVLEHVNNQEYFIECCAKCVKPGGSLFISAVSKTTLAWFNLIFLMEYVLRILPVGLHDKNKFMNSSDTEDIIRSHGFNIRHTQGIFYDVVTRNAYWVPIHSYLYVTHAVKKKPIMDEHYKLMHMN